MFYFVSTSCCVVTETTDANDFFLYFREIEKVFTGRFLYLHSQSTCRCPASHSRVHPLVERYCIPNAANDTTLHKVLRLNQDAHPLHYINDNDIGTTWISSVFPTLELLDKGNTITIDLENGQYQVETVAVKWYYFRCYFGFIVSLGLYLTLKIKAILV